MNCTWHVYYLVPTNSKPQKFARIKWKLLVVGLRNPTPWTYGRVPEYVNLRFDDERYPIWYESIGNGDTFERKASSHEHWRNSHHLVCCFWQSTDRKLEWWCYHVAVRPTIEGRRIPASCHFSKTSFRRVKATLLVINRCWRCPRIGISAIHKTSVSEKQVKFLSFFKRATEQC